MAQDFAKKRQERPAPKRKPRAATKKAPPQKDSHWSWFFSGLLSGLFFAVVAYMGIIRSAPELSAELAEAAGSSESGQETNGLNLDFYDYLPSAEVQVDVVPVDVVSNITDTVEENPLNYLLQAGSFQGRQEAENRRAKIILLNMDANIVPGVVSGRTVYRVQVGPYTGRRSAESAKAELAANNIDSIPLLMRQ